MATITKEMLQYLQSLGLGNTQVPIEAAVPGFAQNFANYQAIPASAQYNPYIVSGDGSPYAQIMARMNSQNYTQSPYGGLLGPTPTGGYNPYGNLVSNPSGNYQGYGEGFGGGSGGGGLDGGSDGGGPSVTTSGGFSGTALGNSALGAAIGAIANAMEGVSLANMGKGNSVSLSDMSPAGQAAAAAMGFDVADSVGMSGMGEGSIGGFGAADGVGMSGMGNDGAGAVGGSVGDGGVSGGGGGGAADAGGTGDGGGGGDGGAGAGGAGGDGGAGSGGGVGGYSRGGLVNKVFGKNPMGQDDGAGYLDLGEYVIRKSAVKKYGKGLLDMINEGKVPAKKIKSLLD